VKSSYSYFGLNPNVCCSKHLEFPCSMICSWFESTSLTLKSPFSQFDHHFCSFKSTSLSVKSLFLLGETMFKSCLNHVNSGEHHHFCSWNHYFLRRRRHSACVRELSRFSACAETRRFAMPASRHLQNPGETVEI
jgi:hypothetical protein